MQTLPAQFGSISLRQRLTLLFGGIILANALAWVWAFAAFGDNKN